MIRFARPTRRAGALSIEEIDPKEEEGATTYVLLQSPLVSVKKRHALSPHIFRPLGHLPAFCTLWRRRRNWIRKEINERKEAQSNQQRVCGARMAITNGPDPQYLGILFSL